MPLYVVATPVGNLEDVSRRAIRVLGEVDCVLAEDTRHTRVLLDAIGVRTPMRAFHDHTDAERRARIVEELAGGVTMALVSDAGTPCVSDPGFALVRDAAAAGVDVVPVPGPSSILAFVSAAGLPTDRFQFVGFPPRKDGARREACAEWLAYEGTTIALESPNRVLGFLEVLVELAPDREIAVGRELTKRFEEFVRGTAAAVLHELRSRERIRGEFVIGVAPCSGPGAPATGELAAWATELHELGVRSKDAARVLSRRLGVPVDEAYACMVSLRREP